VLINVDDDSIKRLFDDALSRYMGNSNPNSSQNKKNVLGYFDVSYLTTWPDSLKKTIDKVMWKIRNGDLPADFWHEKLERLWNDQTTLVDNNFLEPLSPIARKIDKVVNEGLTEIALAIVGKKQLNFVYMAIGSGTTAVAPSDRALVTEVHRINCNQPTTSSGGSAEVKGATIYYNSFFPKSMSTATISEYGIFSSGDIAADECLLRAVFDSADYVSHVVNADAPNVSSIIYQCSV